MGRGKTVDERRIGPKAEGDFQEPRNLGVGQREKSL